MHQFVDYRSHNIKCVTVSSTAQCPYPTHFMQGQCIHVHHPFLTFPTKLKILIGDFQRTQLLYQKFNKCRIFLMMIFGQTQYRLSLAKVGACIFTNAILHEQSYYFDVTLACCLLLRRRNDCAISHHALV